MLKMNGKMKKRDRYYCYIFVDQNGVEPIYQAVQAVQAAHVAMVIGQKMDKKFDAHNIYYQICKMPKFDVYESYTNLNEFLGKLVSFGFRPEIFYEPDVNRIIAVGIHPVRSDKREFLKQFELLKFGD
jgi:hypothetical protein